MPYRAISKTFQMQYKERSEEYRARIRKWNSEGSIVVVDKPTNIASARARGYRAKPEFAVVRVRVRRGRRHRPSPRGGRKPAKNVRFLSPGKSRQAMAEVRAWKKLRHLGYEVVGSYWVGEDGLSKYFEVILKKGMKEKGRADRGLTRAGKKGRGL
ncbi:MAG: hypothetical protein QW035_00825 [Candidatus Anstonellales archaeon]